MVVFVYWIAGIFRFRLGGLECEPWTVAQRCQIAFIFLLCLATLPVTPYGSRLAAYPFQVASQLPLSIANIMEWQPIPFSAPGGKLFLGIIVAFIAVQAVFRFRWRLAEFVLFVVGMVMACLHMRFLLIFVPFTAPLLATIAARWLPRYDRTKNLYALNATLMASIVAIAIHYWPSPNFLRQRIVDQFPVKAVEYIAHHTVPKPMFNAYFFGGYLVWSGAPEHKVFIDGRSELYERSGVLSDYVQIEDVKPAALAILRSYGIESCLILRGAPLGTLLSASPEWKRVYTDNLSAIYVRSQPLGARGSD